MPVKKLISIIILLGCLVSTNVASLKFQLLPKQLQLLNLIEKGEQTWLGYGGARGGAKSHAIRDIALYLGIKYDIYTLIFRRYSQELLDNHINPLFKRYPFLRPYFNKTERILYNPETGNPMLRFGYGESLDDVYKFQGTEYAVIFVDEATQNLEDAVVWLSTSNRDSEGKMPSPPKMVLTMNPGGVGHPFVKRIFIDKQFYDNEIPSDYAFIQASVWDNVFWSLPELRKQGVSIHEYYRKWDENKRKEFTIANSSYAKRLSSLPEQLKMAYLYGDWDVFAGMFFKDFDKKQLIKPFEIPSHWHTVLSIDPGFSSPFSAGLQARDEDGTIFRLYTYYRINKIPDHIQAIKELLNNEHSPLYPITRNRLPDVTVAGHDAFAKLDKNAIISNDLTIEHLFNEYIGLSLEKAYTDRVTGWWKWKSLFPNKYLIFDEYNRTLTKQITSVLADDKIVEDISGRGNDPDVEDHALDDGRYGVNRIMIANELEVPKEHEWLMKQLDNNSSDHYSAMGV